MLLHCCPKQCLLLPCAHVMIDLRNDDDFWKITLLSFFYADVYHFLLKDQHHQFSLFVRVQNEGLVTFPLNYAQAQLVHALSFHRFPCDGVVRPWDNDVDFLLFSADEYILSMNDERIVDEHVWNTSSLSLEVRPSTPYPCRVTNTQEDLDIGRINLS